MAGYGQNGGGPGIVSTLGVLVVGMAACAAWAWSTYPAQVGAVAGRMTGSDYLLLAVFVVLGLIAATMLASVAQALVQVLIHVAQVALLVAVAAAGVILWRGYRGAPSPPPAAVVGPVDAEAATVAAPPADLEEQRRRLEAELLELDTRDGRAWWEHK